MKKTWLCEVHGIRCSLGHPCYECKRELADPRLIREEELTSVYKARKKNAQPRLRLDEGE